MLLRSFTYFGDNTMKDYKILDNACLKLKEFVSYAHFPEHWTKFEIQYMYHFFTSYEEQGVHKT